MTSLGSGSYNYSYSISYSGADDAFLVDIGAPAIANSVTSIMTPTGFTSQFDSGLGLVSFLENTSTFTSTPTSGFSFNSKYAPGADTFTATMFSLTSGSTFTVSGATMGPVTASSAVPEPASLYLLALFVPAALFLRRRNACGLETGNEMGNLHVTNS